MAGQAQPGVHHQRDVGERGPQGSKSARIVQSLTGPDRRAPGHEHPAAGVHEPLGKHLILGRVGEDLEAVGAQRLGGLHQAERIGLQRIGVTDHFELDPVGLEIFARHAGGGDGLAGGVAACRVGQNMNAERADDIPEGLSTLTLAPERDRGDRGTTFAEGRFHHGRRRIARRAEHHGGGQAYAIEIAHA